MRAFIPLALLTFLPCSFASQTPLSSPVIHSWTLIDALSNDSNYTRLLLLLQRTRLVPTLNRLDKSTLFAPTNDAIQSHALWSSASAPEDAYATLADNVKEKLRQQLLYHLLNYSVSDIPTVQRPQIHKTLHFPRAEEGGPRNEPWLPVPGGSLGGEPQRVRWAAREGATWIGTDYAGNGGIQIMNFTDVGNSSKLIGIDGVLEPPRDLAHVVSQQSSLSYFHKILPKSMKKALNSSSELTLFVPQDSAWDELHDVEKLYLESKFSDDDVQKILDMHSVVKHGVRWSDTFEDDKQLTTVYGNNLTLHVSPNATNVSSSSIIQPDDYASNGVLHVVSSLLTPPGALQLTPEKYLLALNCTTFVSLLRSVHLSSLVDTTNSSYTILAPRDDVLALLGGDSLPDSGSAELARVLRYHFLPGQWTEKKLRDGMLVETALEETGLNGGRQVLDITVTGKGSDRELTFGGAAVIGGKPLIINDTIIYLITRALIPPSDALQTALPYLQFSTFLAAVFSSSLAHKLKTSPNTTLLIPPSSAFERLGLVTTHLLLSSSKNDLEKVVQHHAVSEVVYLSSLYNGSRKSYPTLEGSDLHISRSANRSTVYVSPSGGWYGLRGILGGGSSDTGTGNLLTRTGVIHEISGVLLPRSVDISVGKLAVAAKGSTMVSLAVRAGMEWALNGTGPPTGSEWDNQGLGGQGWTLLCPVDAAFKGVNMTALWDDVEAIKRLVEQHLIPPIPSSGSSSPSHMLATSSDPNRPIYFDGKATYSTLLSRSSVYGDIVFRQADSSAVPGPVPGIPNSGGAGVRYLVGIKGARGTNGQNDWANVLSWGRSTSGTGASADADMGMDGSAGMMNAGTDWGVGGVVQIDALLVPYRPAWWVEYGSAVGLGLLGLLLIGGFWWGVSWVWRRDTGEATYEPVGGFDREDDD